MMAAFYHDSSRNSLFAERARHSGPFMEPQKCRVDLLEWSPGIGMSHYYEVGVGNIRYIAYAHVRLREYHDDTAASQDQRSSSAFQSSASLANCV